MKQESQPSKVERMLLFVKKNGNSVYLVMSRQLDRLIARHNSRTVRKYYSEDNVSLDKVLQKAQVIEQAEDEFLNLDDNIEAKLDDNSEQVSEITEEKASLMLKSSKYKLLPKLFSDVNGITCSRKLSRKLINYYLRNRRKDKRIFKNYSQKLSHLRSHGRVSIDDMLHEMYMELGRTLYFSFLGKARDKLKYFFYKYLNPLTSLVIGILGFGGSAAYFYDILKPAVSNFAKFLVKILLTVGINPNTPLGQFWGAMVLGALSAVSVFFALLGLGKLIVGEDEASLEVYDKGREIYKKVKEALQKGLPKMLGTKGIIGLAILWKNKEISRKDVENTVELLRNMKSDVAKYIRFRPEKIDPNLLEEIEENSGFKISLVAEMNEALRSFVLKKSGQRITLPDKIELKPSWVTIDSSSGEGSETTSRPSGNESVPPEIMAIALVKSPNIQINIGVDKPILTIEFDADNYFKDYGNLEKTEVEDFIKSYLEIYDDEEAKKRLAEISKHLGGGIRLIGNLGN
jgi:hypothetical protein